MNSEPSPITKCHGSIDLDHTTIPSLTSVSTSGVTTVLPGPRPPAQHPGSPQFYQVHAPPSQCQFQHPGSPRFYRVQARPAHEDGGLRLRDIKLRLNIDGQIAMKK